MAADKASGRLLSIVDSALILAMFSAVCFVMGHAARLGTARRLRLPLFLMPPVGAETLILVGARYIVLFGAIGLLLYFVWILLGRRIAFLDKKVRPAWSQVELRAKQHPYVYLLLVGLMAATSIYVLPLLLPLTPRSTGGPAIFGGSSSSEVVMLRLKEPDAGLAGRNFNYLWQNANMIVLEDKGSGELVLIREDEIKLLILTRSH